MIDLSIAEKLSTTYKSNKPFPYIIIDNFLPDFITKQCIGEIHGHDTWYYDGLDFVLEYQQNKFFYPKEDTTIEEFKSKLPITKLVLDYLNTPEFISFLERLTGHVGLHRDPVLMGGGIHRIKSGGKLSVHKDYQEHPESHEIRVLNLLIYLNENWKSEWGGNLELWSMDLSHKVVEVEPIFNRAVIFDINDAPHGHPIPLQSPEDVDRYSLALYYFVDETRYTEEGNMVRFYKDSEIGITQENINTQQTQNLNDLFK